jgi:hypothetical protein
MSRVSIYFTATRYFVLKTCPCRVLKIKVSVEIFCIIVNSIGFYLHCFEKLCLLGYKAAPFSKVN